MDVRLASVMLSFALTMIACAPTAGAPSECVGLCRTEVVDSINAAVSTLYARTPTLSPEPAQTEVPDGASITISAVGDISLAREVADRMETNGADYPYALIAPLVDGDIGFANLEGPLTERGAPWPKSYTFRTPPRFAAGLRDSQFGVVTLANNHIMDYGVSGMLDTVSALDGAGIQHAGAGNSGAAATTLAIVTVKGLRVAFVACVLTPNEGSGFDIHAWEAGPRQAGVAVCDRATLRNQIAEGRASADFVIVAVHAGDEYRNVPNATQREFAEQALADGADAFVGAHAHVVQPIEQRGNQLIAWGLGNFIFDLDNVDLANIPEPRVSLILDITLTKGRGVTAFRAIPVTLDATEDRPRPATTAEAYVLQRLIAQ